MKCTIPEISWHNKDPILTLDIQHNSPDGIYRLATGGTDSHVVIWQLLRLENGGVSVEILSDLTRHNRAVNAVRFSPDGQTLASSDDEAAIILWKCNEDKDASHDIFADDNGKDNKENWSILRMLRGHIEDVYDLCWSRCSQFLISGSVDNTAILWNTHKGKNIGLLKDHKGFVQGVAWDPRGQYVGTLSSDRFLRLFNINTKKTTHRLQKITSQSKVTAESKENLPESKETKERSSHLFYDDTLKSFCRRLAFSPDGELILAPTAILETPSGKQINGTHIFSRHCLTRPVVFLPTNNKYTVAVRFCPVYFELKNKPASEGEEARKSYKSMFSFPYRMIFAVASQNAVFFYDTEQPIPFAKVSDIHYTRLSDLSWSNDGLLLVISSTDGYCSLVSFEEGELGVEYKGDITVLDKCDTDKVSPPKKKERLSTPARKIGSIGTPKDSKTGTPSACTPKNTNRLTPKSTPTSTKSSMVKGKKLLNQVHEMSPKPISLSSPKVKSSLPDDEPMEVDPICPGKEEVKIDKELCPKISTEAEKNVEKSEPISTGNVQNNETVTFNITDKIPESANNETSKVTQSPKTEAKPAPLMLKSKKSGKRVQLITLSSKVSTTKPVTPNKNLDKVETDSSAENHLGSSLEDNKLPITTVSKEDAIAEPIASPKRSEAVDSPIVSLTPKAHRRVNLITLSSPKTSTKVPSSEQ